MPFTGMPTAPDRRLWLHLGGDGLDERGSSAIFFTNSTNRVAWKIEYGISDFLMTFSCAILALMCGRSDRHSVDHNRHRDLVPPRRFCSVGEQVGA